MNWHPQAYHVAFCLGKIKGFYKAEGIDLKIIPGRGEATTSSLISADENGFGVLSASYLLKAKLKKMPITAVSGLFQRDLMGIYYRKSAGIKDPSDLAGKTVFTSRASKAEYLLLFLEQQNLGKKVKVRYTSGGSLQTDLDLFLNNRADAVAATCFQDMYEKKNPNPADVGLFCFDAYGSKLITIMLIANDKMIARDPELVRRFVRATNKSWAYSMKHPEEAVKAFLVRYPDLQYEEELRCFKRILPYILSHDKKLGYMSRQDWEEIKKLLLKTGGLEADVDVSRAYTNRFQ